MEAIASKRPSSLVGRRPLVGWRPSRFEVIASNVGWRPSGSLKSGYLRITLCYTFIPSLRVQPFAMHATLRLQKKQINPSQKKNTSLCFQPFAMLSTLRYPFNSTFHQYCKQLPAWFLNSFAPSKCQHSDSCSAGAHLFFKSPSSDQGYDVKS